MFCYFNIRIFEISKNRLFYISSFQILTHYHIFLVMNSSQVFFTQYTTLL